MAEQSRSLNVEADDVIRLMLQFCKEHDLPQSLMTMQEESKVTLDHLESGK